MSQELIDLLEKEWELDTGFLGRLRQGFFDEEGCRRCQATLERVVLEARAAENLPRRLVSLVWYIPLFMTWQRARVRETVNPNEYERVTNSFEAKVEEILGVP